MNTKINNFIYFSFLAIYTEQKIFNIKTTIKYINGTQIGPGSQTINEAFLLPMLTRTANNNEQLINPLTQLNTKNKAFRNNFN
jgi:hypothetical protein